MPGNIAVEAKGLVKRYRKFTAVDGIDLVVERGECFGFLGPNGAGKTTTIRMIHCFSPKTEGILRVFGLDVEAHSREIKSRIGVAPQEDNLDPEFTVLSNLMVYARYFEIPGKVANPRALELLRFVELEEKKGAWVRELSGGMKKRLILARSLINEPALLILDEPTTGLDPQSRHLIWEKVQHLQRGGVTVLLTTHNMEEASNLCNRIVIMDQGKILLEGEPQTLVRERLPRDLLEIISPGEGVAAWLRTSGSMLEGTEERIRVYCEDCRDTRDELDRRFPGQRIIQRTSNLEDLFLKLTGRGLRE